MCWEYKGEEKQMGSLHHGTHSLGERQTISLLNNGRKEAATVPRVLQH